MTTMQSAAMLLKAGASLEVVNNKGQALNAAVIGKDAEVKDRFRKPLALLGIVIEPPGAASADQTRMTGVHLEIRKLISENGLFSSPYSFYLSFLTVHFFIATVETLMKLIDSGSVDALRSFLKERIRNERENGLAVLDALW